MRQRALRPVYVGTLQVQMIAEDRGPELTGKVLRIENKGASEIELTEAMVAPASALAVSIAEARLAPGTVTTSYFVSHNAQSAQTHRYGRGPSRFLEPSASITDDRLVGTACGGPCRSRWPPYYSKKKLQIML